MFLLRRSSILGAQMLLRDWIAPAQAVGSDVAQGSLKQPLVIALEPRSSYFFWALEQARYIRSLP